MQQNTPAFGFIPIYGLGSRIINRKQGSVCNDILQLHRILRSDGGHNYEGLQIPVASKLNYDVWSNYLTEYWDWQLPLLIKYGFPLDFNRNSPIVSEKINHKSATSYPDHVDVYLKEEIDNKAMLGPFATPPIENLHASPFMTHEKSNSDNRRVIIDLSWPIGESVNAGVTPDKYLGVDFILSYPSVDNIVAKVLKLGKGCQIFKVDISRAFCHVPIDPGDLDLLGLHWVLDLSTGLPFSSVCPMPYALLWPKKISPSGTILMIFYVCQHLQKLTPRMSDYRNYWHLNLIFDKLGLADSGFTFHSFRRSGATFAFNNDVAWHLDVGLRMEVHY